LRHSGEGRNPVFSVSPAPNVSPGEGAGQVYVSKVNSIRPDPGDPIFTLGKTTDEHGVRFMRLSGA